MPSVSKAQQRFMGLVHAYKKGEVPASQVSQAVKDAAKSMKKKSTKKMASTKHKGLPNKVRSENMNEDVFAIVDKYDDRKQDYDQVYFKDNNLNKVKKQMKKMGRKYGKMNLIRVKSNGKMSVVENLKEDGHTDVASAERKLKLIIKDAMDTLNALRGLSNEDSLPSWWTDKITLAKDYVGKSRDYIMNPAESVNEGKLDRIASTLVADLNKEFTRYNPKKISDFNKLIKYLGKKMPRVPKSKIEDIAMTFDEIMRDEAGNVVVNSREQRARMKSTLKKLGMKESVNEDITSAGYYFLRKAAYSIEVALKDLNKGIKKQDDKRVLPEVEYIYDKATDMKKMMKNKRYNESVNENFYVLYSPKNKVSTPTARIYGKEKDAIKFAKEKSKTHMTMILTKKEIRKIGAFNLENVNETPQMAKQGQVGILIKLANKQLQNVFSLHKRGKNKEAKVVLNNKVYSTMEYISRAFKTLGESVNEVSGVDVAKKVLKNKQHEKGIDLQTANLIVTIDKAYDKNPRLQKKFRALQLPKMKQLILKYYG